MTVVRWTSPGNGNHPPRQTSNHVTIDGIKTVCSRDVRPDATVIATVNWYLHATCYNCVYRLWADHAPPGYVRPADGKDFPLRAECPHRPGEGIDPRSCPSCPPEPRRRPEPRPNQGFNPPPGRRKPRDPGNPDPAVIRRWHIDNPYNHETCALCGEHLDYGELINIEYEAGVMHAACSDPD